MQDHHIKVNDLHALVSPRLKEFQRQANVHFHPQGSQAMGTQVAETILAQLDLP